MAPWAARRLREKQETRYACKILRELPAPYTELGAAAADWIEGKIRRPKGRPAHERATGSKADLLRGCLKAGEEAYAVLGRANKATKAELAQFYVDLERLRKDVRNATDPPRRKKK